MEFKVLGCSGGQVPERNLSCYLVDGQLLIDAGSMTAALDLESQRKIENVLITHSHLDHVVALAFASDNLLGGHKSTIKVWGIKEAVEALSSSFFNDVIWPDFTRLTTPDDPVPVVSLHEIEEERAVEIGGYEVTAVRVNHSIPCAAYFIGNGSKTILHLGDTGPTERVWKAARSRELCAVIIESSFPNRLGEVARLSGHLTPQLLAGELAKLARPRLPVYVTHLKPQYRDEVIEDLSRLSGFSLTILNDGDVFHF
jgi:ribonuclease BN (tRNA processing enzyme)